MHFRPRTSFRGIEDVKSIPKFDFILLQELGHVCRQDVYDICAGDSHRLIIVKEICACECHLH